MNAPTAAVLAAVAVLALFGARHAAAWWDGELASHECREVTR